MGWKDKLNAALKYLSVDPEAGYAERLIDEKAMSGDRKGASEVAKNALMADGLSLGMLAGAGAYGYFPALAAKLGFGAQGTYNLASKDGVRKTINLAKDGNYKAAALSAGGDALNAAMVLPGAKLLGNVAKYGVKTAIAGDMLNTSVNTTKLAASEPLLNVGRAPGNTTLSNPTFSSTGRTSYAFSERPSKLTKNELDGVSKEVRNQPNNPKITDLYKTTDHPNTSSHFLSNQDSIYENINFDHFLLNKNISPELKAAIESYNNSINPAVNNAMITEFRNYYGDLGISLDSISDEAISRMLSAQIEELSSNVTNPALKNYIGWHASPYKFDSVQYVPENVNGHRSGKFFFTSSYPNRGYGLYHQNGPKHRSYMNDWLNQFRQTHLDWYDEFGMIKPEYRTKFGELREKANLDRYKEINKIGGKDYSKNVQPYVMDTPKFKYLLDENLEFTNPNAEVPWTSSEGSVGNQVAIPINGSIIKSIFPHPSTLKEGKFIRDWNNSNINLKQGGTLKRVKLKK